MLRLKSNKKDQTATELRCRTKLLTGDELDHEFNNTQLGQQLFDWVANHLQLVDKEYYGLKFEGQNQWLDLAKSIHKQTKGLDEYNFEFRFKFYPADPSMSNQEMTRYFLFLQLRSDLLNGRLQCHSIDDLAHIIACILQSELGDHNDTLGLDYVSQFKLVADQTPEIERAAALAHQSEDVRGLSPSEAEHHFLKRVARLDTYGVDPFSVTDYSSSNQPFLIGVNHAGILTYHEAQIIQHFPWREVRKISLDGRTVILQTGPPSSKDKKKSTALFGFKCDSNINCHNLWKLAMEHRYFFTVDSSDKVPAVTNAGGLFNRSCKLRYSGKVERELLLDTSRIRQTDRAPIKRTRSLILRGPLNHQGGSGSLKAGPNRLSALGEESINGTIEEEGSNNYRSGMNRTLPSSLVYMEENSSSSQQTLPTEFNLKPNISPMHESTKGLTKSASNQINRQVQPYKTRSKRNSLAASNLRRSSSRRSSRVVSILFYLTIVALILMTSLIVVNEFDHPSLNAIRTNAHMIKIRSTYYLPAKKTLFDVLDRFVSFLDTLYY